MRKILVCGGRNFNDWVTLFAVMDALQPEMSALICGMARGADRLAHDWAVARGVPIEEYPADWERYGKAAGYRRNHDMLTRGYPDLVIAFPGGAGTRNMVEIARKAGVEVRMI
jgi:hypothetical protein